MTIQIRKTYNSINPEMLCDEIRALVQKQGIVIGETKFQTYPLPSGLTQSRITLVFKAQTAQKKDGGYAHIISSPEGDTKLLLDLDEKLISQEAISNIQGDLDFILGSYEVKW